MYRATLLVMCTFGFFCAAEPRLEIEPEVSITSPTDFVLSHNGYQVPYSDLSGMRTFILNVGKTISKTDQLQLDLVGNIGYGSLSTSEQWDQNSHSISSSLNLQWVPISVAAHLQYLGFKVVKPGLVVSSGVQYFGQQGSLPGLDNSFWIPDYSVSADLTFFNADSNDLFDGFTFGITYHHSMATNQIYAGWSFDLGIDLQL
jgi:hypothetical protein